MDYPLFNQIGIYESLQAFRLHSNIVKKQPTRLSDDVSLLKYGPGITLKQFPLIRQRCRLEIKVISILKWGLLNKHRVCTYQVRST